MKHQPNVERTVTAKKSVVERISRLRISMVRSFCTTSHAIRAKAFMTAPSLADTGFADLQGRVQADSFHGLLVDYAERKHSTVVIRGLRAVSDFEYEFQMAMMNHRLKPKLETLFMMTGESEFYTSSRLVKEVVSLGGDVSGLVPDNVLKMLKQKFNR